VLTDVLAAPAVREHELDAEREVILEELALSEDTPTTRSHAAERRIVPRASLGREVLGNEDSVEAMTRADVLGFFSDRYSPPTSSSLPLAGSSTTMSCAVSSRSSPASTPVRPRPQCARPRASSRSSSRHRDTEQAPWRWGGGPSRRRPDRLRPRRRQSGARWRMASRLFQEVREERGMA